MASSSRPSRMVNSALNMAGVSLSLVRGQMSHTAILPAWFILFPAASRNCVVSGCTSLDLSQNPPSMSDWACFLEIKFPWAPVSTNKLIFGGSASFGEAAKEMLARQIPSELVPRITLIFRRSLWRLWLLFRLWPWLRRSSLGIHLPGCLKSAGMAAFAAEVWGRPLSHSRQCHIPCPFCPQCQQIKLAGGESTVWFAVRFAMLVF